VRSHTIKRILDVWWERFNGRERHLVELLLNIVLIGGLPGNAEAPELRRPGCTKERVECIEDPVDRFVAGEVWANGSIAFVMCSLDKLAAGVFEGTIDVVEQLRILLDELTLGSATLLAS
jgi:hypothetical protein